MTTFIDWYIRIGLTTLAVGILALLVGVASNVRAATNLGVAAIVVSIAIGYTASKLNRATRRRKRRRR